MSHIVQNLQKKKPRTIKIDVKKKKNLVHSKPIEYKTTFLANIAFYRTKEKKCKSHQHPISIVVTNNTG